MSRGANPAIAAAFGLAALLTAGIASADCGPSHKQSVSAPQPPATDTVAKPDTTSGRTRG